MWSEIEAKISEFDLGQITEERKSELEVLINYVVDKRRSQEPVNLNFICTHNSRRSQFSQIWATVAAFYNGINVNCFSGGVEVTEFNLSAVQSLERFGFEIKHASGSNPIYKVTFAEGQSIDCFSKLFNHSTSPNENFATIMTCSSADENCPFIPGAEKRISMRYEDPKEFDGTPEESEQYDLRSTQIATELFYVFSRVKLVS
ncbi:MAG: protein-tyrosine-phosphatase [Salibacteraceae bacterium]